MQTRLCAQGVIIDDFTNGNGNFIGAANASDLTVGLQLGGTSITHDATVGHFALGSFGPPRIGSCVAEFRPAPKPGLQNGQTPSKGVIIWSAD